MADLLTEVNTAHNNGQRSMGRESNVKRAMVDSVIHRPNANMEPGYIFAFGLNTIRFQDSDTASMDALKAGFPAVIGHADKFEFDPKCNIEYTYDAKNKCYHLLSIRQLPGKPKPIVKLPSWAKTLDEVGSQLAEWRAGEAWAKEVLGDDMSTWPSIVECLAKLDEKRIVPPPFPTKPEKPAQVKEEVNVSEIPFETIEKRAQWLAETDKDVKEIARIKMIEAHFKRELDKVKPDADLGATYVAVLGCSVYDTLDKHGLTGTVDKLQAYLDNPIDLTTTVDVKETEPVTDNAGLASKALTAQDWAAFLAEKQVKSAQMLKVLGLKKLSEWPGTLEDAWTIYRTKTTPVVPDEPTDVADQDGEPAEDEDVNEMEGYDPDIAKYADPADLERPAALAPIAKAQPVDVTPVDRTPREVAVVSHPTPVSPFAEQWQIMRQQAAVFIKSGFLPKEINTPEKAITIMMMGNALHVDPIVALNNINVVNGKAAVSPQLMMGLVRRSGQLESFKCTDDGNACTVVIKRRGEPSHTEVFSMADAAAMNLVNKDNWKKQPATMRKWRAISATVRVTFSDVAWGLASYTAEELNPDIAVDYSE